MTFVLDDEEDLIPDSTKTAEAAAYIEELRPVTAEVIVFAPTASPLDPTVQVSPDTTAVRAAVQAQLADLIRRKAEPGGTLYVSQIREAISRAVGENDHVLVSPTENVVSGPGEIVVLGEITWA